MTIYNYKDSRTFSNLYLSISYYVYVFLKNVFFTFATISSFVLLIYFKSNKALENSLKNFVFLVTYPYSITTDIISYGINDFTDYILNFKNINNLNNYLMKQNFDLQVKVFENDILKRENEELKNVINIAYNENINDYTISKFNIIEKSNFVNKIRIKSNHKISDNDIVIDKYGNLVGKIINNDGKTAEILLAIDSNFKVASMLNKSFVKVILSGNNSNLLDINYFLGEKFNIIDDELAYTSNDGDEIQSGIFIGNIVKDKDKSFVRISTDLSKVNYVVILHKSEKKIKLNNLNMGVDTIKENKENSVTKVINKSKYNTVVDNLIQFDDI